MVRGSNAGRGKKFVCFPKRSDRLCDRRSVLFNGVLFFLGKGGGSVKYNAGLYLVPRLTMSGITPLLYLYAQMALEMVDFTFVFYRYINTVSGSCVSFEKGKLL
jgi:hypothetical protein